MKLNVFCVEFVGWVIYLEFIYFLVVLVVFNFSIIFYCFKNINVVVIDFCILKFVVRYVRNFKRVGVSSVCIFDVFIIKYLIVKIFLENIFLYKKIENLNKFKLY